MTGDGPLMVCDDGLWIPPELREFDTQIVIRTPKVTIQHFARGGDTDIGPFFGAVGADHFGAPADDPSTSNPELAPDRVSIKPQGEEAEEFTIEVRS